MRTFVTTVGTAAFIGFAGLGVAAIAGASPAAAPLSTGTLTTVHGSFAESGNGASRQSDQTRACVERARINGYADDALPVAGMRQCPINQIP